MSALKGKKILLGVTASISAYRACDLITGLRNDGAEVTVVMTRDAEHFITKLSLQSFAGREVIVDFFQTEGRTKPVHIELAKAHDAILIAPASADIIAKLAHGFAEDVLSCTVLASKAPKLVAPAMNENMFFNKFTQENIKRLESNGFTVIPPIKGHLVCMDQGMGHLAEIADIVSAVTKCC